MKHARPARHLDELARIHDENAIRHVVRDAQVVRDEQVGHPRLALQILEQVEHACLSR